MTDPLTKAQILAVNTLVLTIKRTQYALISLLPDDLRMKALHVLNESTEKFTDIIKELDEQS